MFPISPDATSPSAIFSVTNFLYSDDLEAAFFHDFTSS